MSRDSWNDFWGYQRPPKRPPPKQGIAVKKIGATWWGRRWIEAPERISSGYSNRLSRGRSYARGGRVHDLELEHGRARARVTGSRVYRVEIEVAALSATAWSKAIAQMASRAAFAAKLLGGAMPEEIEEAFVAAKSRLFPSKAGDLSTSCSCPDWANPCKHVAAVHFVLGEAFDRDPFLLFELRGKRKDEVLDALRQARAAADEPTPPKTRPRRSRRAASAVAAEPTRAAARVPSVELGAVAGGSYERPRGRLPALRFHLEAPTAHALVLRQLGAPPSWSAEESILEVLSPLCESAGALARSMADGARTPCPASARPARALESRPRARATAKRRPSRT